MTKEKIGKKELIEMMAEKSGFTKKDTEKALAAFIESVQDSLKEDKKVQLTGFGAFECRERAARIGRNPKTGEEINIEKSTVPTFKAGAEFKRIIKEN